MSVYRMKQRGCSSARKKKPNRKRQKQAEAVEIVRRVRRPAGWRRQKEKRREAREELQRQLIWEIAFRRQSKERSETVIQDQRTTRTGQERRNRERGSKRSAGEWEEFANTIKIKAEARAEESKNPGEGVDINPLHVAGEIGAAPVGESGVKFDETVFDFINSAWRECEGELCYDAIS